MTVEGLEFVFDRTWEDVERVRYLNERYLNGMITDEEKQEWNTGIGGTQGLKGAFNLSDVNRFEKNCGIIGELAAVSVSVKEWEYGDIPRESDYERFRSNAQKIRDVFAFSSTPKVPERPINNFKKWNDMEKILHDAYISYARLQSSYYYCNTELYAGERVGDT